MNVDVWISAWEVQCCYHPLVVGQEWSGITAFGDVNPVVPESEQGFVRLDNGETKLVGRVIESFDSFEMGDTSTLVQAGPLRVLIYGKGLPSLVGGTGRVFQTVHGPSPFGDDDVDRIANRGFIRRIWTISNRYRDRAPLPAEVEAFRPPTLIERIRYKLRFSHRIPVSVPKRLRPDSEVSEHGASFDDDGRLIRIHELVDEEPPVEVKRVDHELDGELVRLEVELATTEKDDD